MMLLRLCVYIILLMLFNSVYAVDFKQGDFYGRWGAALSYEQLYRVNGPNYDLISLANGGRAFSTNGDNGNLNYLSGTFSTIVELTTDFQINYKKYGLLFRTNVFNNFENSYSHMPLTSEADRLVTSNLNLLEAYVSADFNPLTVRIGEQVIDWGESSLLPVGMVWGSIGVTDSITLEAYYQYDNVRAYIAPEGSYFSTDIIGDGNQRMFLGFGDISDLGTTIPGASTGLPRLGRGYVPQQAGGFNREFGSIPRGTDDQADRPSEFGVAMHLSTNNTDLSFYFANYHSRLPIVSMVSGSRAGIGNAVAAATGVGAVGLGLDPTVSALIGNIAGKIAHGNNPVGAAKIGADCAYAYEVGLIPAEYGGAPSSFPPLCMLDQYTQTARYFFDYPEDMQLFGFSFNTELPNIAFQGRYSYRRDVPLQIDKDELLLATVSVLNNDTTGTMKSNSMVVGFKDNQVTRGWTLPTDTMVQGYIDRSISQVEMGVTKIFGPTLKADSAVLTGEVAATYVHNMPDKDVLRLEAPGTYTTGNPFHAGVDGFHAGKAAESSDHFPDAMSWGYQVSGSVTYKNAIGAINITPQFEWRHDVSGITPGPGGDFLAGRKEITFGLGFDYKDSVVSKNEIAGWQGHISYTNFFGAGRYNLLNDRDFVSFRVSYRY